MIETEKLLDMDKETSRSRQVIEGVLNCSRNCGFVALFAMLFFVLDGTEWMRNWSELERLVGVPFVPYVKREWLKSRRCF